MSTPVPALQQPIFIVFREPPAKYIYKVGQSSETA